MLRPDVKNAVGYFDLGKIQIMCKERLPGIGVKVTCIEVKEVLMVGIRPLKE